MPERTSLHPSCKSMEHLINIYMFKGRPINNDPERDVTILLNHGYAVGFCPQRLLPIWTAYRVAGADSDIDFDRPHLYYDDNRLDEKLRISPKTFGTHDGVQYHVGHMVPNEVINRQFGRLAQMETFLMSNMCPQRRTLNTGVWKNLEDKIRNIEETLDNDHVWAIAGPIFGDDPDAISRLGGLEVPIPEAFYYITVDPYRYPWDRESNVDVACFIFPQDAPSGTPLEDYLCELEDIEEKTQLSFFPGWQVGFEALDADVMDSGSPESRHRLLKQLDL